MLTLVAVLVIGMAGLSALSLQTRCVDAAREAARLAARGDSPSAIRTARQVAPAGATIELHRSGDFVIATVIAESGVLPRLPVRAEAMAAVEERSG